MSLGRSEFADGVAARSLSEISELDAVRIGTDIVSASRRLIVLLRSIGDSHWLHHPPVISEAIRRYDELWMPLISDLTVGSKPLIILPPLDVEWVWFCHSLNPVSYRDYCQKRFSKLIGKPAIYDEENEDYAVSQCEKFWIRRYPDENFENRVDPDSPEIVSSANEDIKTEVEKQRFLWEKFSAPYMSETVYLIAARLRYKGFLLILHKFKEEISRLVPASDILLMWLTHQSYPTIYTEDVGEMLEEMMRKVVQNGEAVEKSEVETTKKLWNRYFNQPYEKAGGELTAITNESRLRNNTMFYWPVSDIDINTAYKSIRPRFVLQLCIFIRLNPKAEQNESSFLRLRVARCHRKLQLDKKLTDLSRDGSWQKGWHIYCEFGTQGVVLESHCDRRRGICLRRRKREEMIAFLWNDLLRAHSLASGRFVGKEVSVFASVTPPVQAPYLLRFVPDRVTDDSGAMIADSVQRTNNFRPQEGRWLTRTVLDHAGRECFVIRIRVGKGVFKRGSEVPSPVKSEERITEIRVGSWSYVEGSIGKAPVMVVGTVTPKEQVEDWDAAWEFSSGDELFIRCDSPGSISELGLHSTKPGSRVRLLTGRRMQYKGDSEEDEEGFVTMVRSTEEDPTEKATALIDWKHQAVEFLPEEDAVLVLLLSVSILRSVTQKRREDVGKLLVRKRITEATGERDWGSVIVDASSSNVSSSSSSYLEPWYRNSGKVMAVEEKAQVARYPYPVMSYSNVDGGDSLYKHVIFG
ncbi:hypothetical protein N665_0220s0001 [Sinapis alba]|nr:hypothetical protein N665_0220s0001 [Sinapis alba]